MTDLIKPTGVIQNTPHSDGTISSTVRVRAISWTGAMNKGINRALLHNGFSPTIVTSSEADVTAEEVTRESARHWIVEVEIDTPSQLE